jgi:hypothetical protein
MVGPEPNPAGYSGTPLHRKLGIRPDADVLVVGPPAEFEVDLLAPPGLGVRLVTSDDIEPGAAFDVLLLFCRDGARMAELLPAGMAATERGGRCWVAWPKRASGLPTDLSDNVVRDAALAVGGWVDVKVAAVDRVWSGLCLMRRTSGRSRSGG